jgi:alkylhydroperoxidase family enzyme
LALDAIAVVSAAAVIGDYHESVSELDEALVPVAPDDRLYAEAKKLIGVIPTALRYLTPVPWAFRFYAEIIKPPCLHAPIELLQHIVYVTSYENACRYCYGSQEAVLRVIGYSDKEIARLRERSELAELDPKHRLVLELARKLARSSPRPARAEREAMAAAGWGAEVTAELAFKVAAHCFTNRVSTSLAIPPDAELEGLRDRWYYPFVRPFMRRKLLSRGTRAPGAIAGPFAPILEAMAGVPVASTLREAIDLALASPVLARRTKALIFAVVGRTIGCAVTEREARALIDLDTHELDRAIDHLRAPALDRLEAILVPYARETVRYERPVIMARTRELATSMRPDELIEAVAVAALANTLGRVGMLLA